MGDIEFLGDFFYLVFDLFVFGQFLFQETGGDFGFLFQAPGGEHICVGDFLRGVFEPFHFDDALFRQFGEYVVGFAQADAQFSGQGPLGEVRLDGQEFQYFVPDLLFKGTVHGWNI